MLRRQPCFRANRVLVHGDTEERRFTEKEGGGERETENVSGREEERMHAELGSEPA